MSSEACVGGATGLCNFALVVRKNIVFATGMDVELFAQITNTHRRTLDVPAREAPPNARGDFWPWLWVRSPGFFGMGIPLHEVSGVRFPERKVSGGLFE